MQLMYAEGVLSCGWQSFVVEGRLFVLRTMRKETTREVEEKIVIWNYEHFTDRLRKDKDTRLAAVLVERFELK